MIVFVSQKYKIHLQKHDRSMNKNKFLIYDVSSTSTFIFALQSLGANVDFFCCTFLNQMCKGLNKINHIDENCQQPLQSAENMIEWITFVTRHCEVHCTFTFFSQVLFL